MSRHSIATAAIGARRAPDRRRWLLVAAVGSMLLLFGLGPIAQWPGYHAFADARRLGAMPNAANVLSNVPFAIIGGWALWQTRRERRTGGAPRASASFAAWRMFAAAVLCTAFGSAAYHVSPGDAPLVFDRLPIAVACAALACAFLAERVDPRFGSARVAFAAALVGAGSVAWWWLGERAGHGDLRPYLWVQFMPMLLVTLGLLLRIRPVHPSAGLVPVRAWWAAIALYAVAKGLEGADAAVLHATGSFVSGHTLKHLLAAAGAFALLRNGSRR